MPAPLQVLYDGHCRFCQRQMRKLLRLARPGALAPVDFQAPGALDAFEGVTWEECMQAMIVVAPDGRRWQGAEAAARALVTRRVLGAWAWLYYLPGLRQLLNAAYRAVARRRYRLAGRAVAEGECEEGSCALHFPEPDAAVAVSPPVSALPSPAPTPDR